jgi:hypothetical protein
VRFPAPPFEHLLRLSDETGVLEHPVLAAPEPAHGYCTDDVARALVVVLRRGAALEALAERCLAFLERAQVGDGRRLGAPAPRTAFDQQPIEAAAMADACARAFDITGNPRWSDPALRAAAWFLDVNDVGVSLLDPVSGGCHNGLTPHGVNGNEGAELTLALIAALQQARRLQAASRSAARISDVRTVAAPTQQSAAP